MRDVACGSRSRRETASERLFDHYRKKLIRFADRQLAGRGAIRSIADEEDVVLQAFAEVFLGNPKGILQQGHRDDLEKMLYCITRRGVIKQVARHRKQHRPSPVQAPHSADSVEDMDAIQQIPSPGPSPEAQAIASEAVEKLYEYLAEEVLQKILTLRLMGHTNLEIASQLDCAIATVERKFKLIRDKLEKWPRALKEPS
jgi:RNA polymerase sigma factor (sigma-70 family)